MARAHVPDAGDVHRRRIERDPDGDSVRRRVADSNRFGLASMRERVEVMGATLEVQSAPGQGTTVEVLWS
jgi:signal transduction histidine kinase